MARFDFMAKYGYTALEATQRNAEYVARMAEKQALHDNRQSTPGKMLAKGLIASHNTLSLKDWMRMTGIAAQARSVRMVS